MPPEEVGLALEMRYTERSGDSPRAPRAAQVGPPAAIARARGRFSLDVGYRDTGSGRKFRRPLRVPCPWVHGCRDGYFGAPVSRPSSSHRRRLLLALAAGAVLLAACAVAVASLRTPSEADGGAVAAPASAPGAYVALGDSYSSGVGAGSYLRESGACLRSRRAYPFGLGRRVTSFRACGGARTDDVLSLQLEPFPSDTRLVTITIGGNDAGFADVLERCLFGSQRACDRRVDAAERFVRGELPARLRRVYERIRERAPQATVVVAGYPRLFARRPWCGGVGRIDEREQRRLNEGANLLVRTIAAEVGRHRGFRFVDVREAFEDGGVCASAPRILGVARPGFTSFHPTARGQATYARVIRRRL